MKTLRFLIVLLALCFASQSIHAHEGHDDQLGLDEAIEVGKTEIKRLANEGLIDGSWKALVEFNYDKTDMQTITGKRRWVIAFDNASENDSAKKTILIIMTPLGKLVSYEFFNK